MSSGRVVLVLLTFLNAVLLQDLQGAGSGDNGNLRLCVVEGRGSYKRAPKFCPILDEENAGVECVIGTDRLDCLRRISKGTVDFGVFSPEDLVAAQWADIDVLVVNELRLTARPYERNVVAVVNKRILPDSSSTLHAVLRNSTLCHPGVGVDDIRPLSDTLSGYLESLVLERSCDPNLSLTENRLKALAGFFGKACKAGPWVPDKVRDAELKTKYSSLCAACGNPSRCSTSDRYWGDVGALTCLGEFTGDVTWAEFNDVDSYFGLSDPKNGAVLSTERFAYLCRDGTWQPLTNNTKPCVWLHRPWSIIIAKRKAAAAVSSLAELLSNSSVKGNGHWQGALTALLESHREQPEPLHPPQAPMDYLAAAKGFRDAYSQSGCDPPRHITLCATSLLAKNKCDWLSEAGAVYGVTPPLQCSVRENERECMKAVRSGDCDVSLAGSDWLVAGLRDFDLIPVLHEATPIVEMTNTIVAYVKNDSMITKMADLRGKRAAFPRYDSAAWHSVIKYLTGKEKISCKEAVNSYFKEICAPGIENGTEVKDNWKNCYEGGEIEALKSLVDGKSDVAFVSMMTYKMVAANQIPEPWTRDVSNIIPVCPEENAKYCFLSWSNIGHMFAPKNVSVMRRHEIINVFTKLDQMFGKHPPFQNPMFSMYGAFNHKLNILFHNNTRSLTTDDMLRMHPYDKIPFNFERSISNMTTFECNFGAKTTPSLLLLITLVFYLIYS